MPRPNRGPPRGGRMPGGHSDQDSEVVRATKRINGECAAAGDVRGARALLETLILGRGMQPTLVRARPWSIAKQAA